MSNAYWDLVNYVLSTKDLDSSYVDEMISRLDINSVHKTVVNQIKSFNENYLLFNGHEINIKEFIEDILNEQRIDTEFLININKDEAIKDILDENSNHFVKDHNLLSGAVDNVYETGYYDSELKKLAVIWYRLVKNHPFSNGNKRTAMIGVKISFLTSLVDGFAKNIIEFQDSIIDDYFKNNVKVKVMQNALTRIHPNHKKISKKSVERTIKHIIDKTRKQLTTSFDDKWRNDISNHFLKTWKMKLSEDYVLSVYIASLKGSQLKEEEYENVLEILECNIVSFFINSTEYLNRVFIELKENIDEYINNEVVAKVTPHYFLEQMKFLKLI